MRKKNTTHTALQMISADDVSHPSLIRSSVSTLSNSQNNNLRIILVRYETNVKYHTQFTSLQKNGSTLMACKYWAQNQYFFNWNSILKNDFLGYKIANLLHIIIEKNI